MFFASAAKTIGGNKGSYFAESCTIGIGCPSYNFMPLDSSDVLTKNSEFVFEESKKADYSERRPMNDSSLFGIDSDSDSFPIQDADLSEAEDFLSLVKHADPLNASPSVLCTLNRRELSYSVSNKSALLLIRFPDPKTPTIVTRHDCPKDPSNATHSCLAGQNVSGSVAVREGDLLIVSNKCIANGAEGAEEFIGLMKDIMKERKAELVSPLEIANEVASYIYSKSTSIKANKTTSV